MEIQEQQETLKVLNALDDPILLICNRGKDLTANTAFLRRYPNQVTQMFSRETLVCFKKLCKEAWQKGKKEGVLVAYDLERKPHLINIIITRLTLAYGTLLLAHWQEKPVFSTLDRATQEAQDVIALHDSAQGPMAQVGYNVHTQVEKLLKESFLNFDEIVMDWPMPTYVLDKQGCFVHGNKIFAKSLGIENSSLAGKTFKNAKTLSWKMTNDLEILHRHFLEYPISDVVDMAFVYPNGNTMETRAHFSPVLNEKKELVFLVVLLVDYTEENYLRDLLRTSEERWQLAINASSSGFCDFIHDSKTLFCAKGVYDLLQVNHTDLMGKDLTYFAGFITEKSQIQKEVILNFLAGKNTEDSLVLDTQMLCGTQPRWIRWRLLAMRQENTGALLRTIIVFSDITEQKRYERELADKAYLDFLTQLPNRGAFKKRLDIALANLVADEIFAIIVLDLDGFKAVNDTFGHQAGDQLLQIVARRILENIKPTDFVARMGGDEFFCILQDITTKQDAITRCEAILQAIQKPISLETGDITIAASIGLAIAPTDSKDLTTLMRMADKAMYQAKHLGKNRICTWAT